MDELRPTRELGKWPMMYHYVAINAPIVNDIPQGAFLVRTNGRTKGGIGRNYVVWEADYRVKRDGCRSRKFKAESDAEAIEHANKILAKWTR